MRCRLEVRAGRPDQPRIRSNHLGHPRRRRRLRRAVATRAHAAGAARPRVGIGHMWAAVVRRYLDSAQRGHPRYVAAIVGIAIVGIAIVGIAMMRERIPCLLCVLYSLSSTCATYPTLPTVCSHHRQPIVTVLAQSVRDVMDKHGHRAMRVVDALRRAAT